MNGKVEGEAPGAWRRSRMTVQRGALARRSALSSCRWRWFRIAAVCLPLSAAANEQAATVCRNGLFAAEQQSLQVATLLGAAQQRFTFHRDDAPCPDDSEGCRQRAYLLAGDEVLISKVVGNWACAWFVGKKRETVGWLKASDLQFRSPGGALRAADWIGVWRYSPNDGQIRIAGRQGRLTIDGSASWLGAASAAGVRVVHTGEMTGELAWQGRRARFMAGSGADDCAAELTQVGRYLVVADNGHCGGANVRFDGVYLRER